MASSSALSSRLSYDVVEMTRPKLNILMIQRNDGKLFIIPTPHKKTS
ncbi:MAG: hypothetical protein PHW52_01925 [Candidatus Pacebacteria bacterium]|nr:hypothetical protein [Candidatus Paceibacterota bacterium]